MKATRVSIICVLLCGVLAGIYALSATDTAALEPAYFHVLVAADGEFTEVSYQVNPDELSMLFDGAVLTSLLDGRYLQLTPDVIDALSEFFDTDLSAGYSDVFARFGPIASWACVKCCYLPDSECCCPDLEPPDPKDPDGD